jgi:cystathionine beta-lyase/cystathionine gamma-synthase
MAASTTALLSLLAPGDEVLASASLYGGTTKLIRDVLSRLGFGFRLLEPDKLARVDELAGERSRLVVFETPTNPNVDVVDIERVVRGAHARGMLVMLDNTFATPVLQRPLALGVDLVMHSLTKSLSGHSDLIGGALLGPRATIERAHSLSKVLGACLDPHSAFLALRGLKTVHLRVPRQCQNAMALAQRLLGHAKLSRVLYPGLPGHPGHEVARRQMSAFGGVVAFSLKGGLEAAERFYDALRLIARAASLGGVESLISLPLHTSHHGYSAEQLAAAGVDPGMVRIALGVEDEDDLIADVEQALVAA